jgi:hypothetical protein
MFHRGTSCSILLPPLQYSIYASTILLLLYGKSVTFFFAIFFYFPQQITDVAQFVTLSYALFFLAVFPHCFAGSELGVLWLLIAPFLLACVLRNVSFLTLVFTGVVGAFACCPRSHGFGCARPSVQRSLFTPRRGSHSPFELRFWLWQSLL